MDRRIDQLEAFPESYQAREVVPGKVMRVFYIMGYSGYHTIINGEVVIHRILPSRMDPTVPLLHS